VQDLIFQGFLLGISLPHSFPAQAGYGFLKFLFVALIIWFAFLVLIGVFKK
jgi:hypothetical protein